MPVAREGKGKRGALSKREGNVQIEVSEEKCNSKRRKKQLAKRETQKTQRSSKKKTGRSSVCEWRHADEQLCRAEKRKNCQEGPVDVPFQRKRTSKGMALRHKPVTARCGVIQKARKKEKFSTEREGVKRRPGCAPDP